jgi:phenylacetic acid degradation operon negative regulatory protein
VSSILDDLDTRPGSASSLLRTLVGASIRDLDGWMSSAAFVWLLGQLGVSAARTRNALTRAKAKGLLRAEIRTSPGYALTEEGHALLARGDRRIFHPRLMSALDPWCLISFSVPESNRDLRHQLRRRLTWIGCGVVADALRVCPEFLADEVSAIVSELGLGDHVTLFRAHVIHSPEDPAADLGRWWDLPAIAALHEKFLASHATAIEEFTTDPQPATAYRTWITALDAWRPIPYLDPGLPAELLPAGWPGNRSIPLFLQFRDNVVGLAAAYVRSAAARLRPATRDRSIAPLR